VLVTAWLGQSSLEWALPCYSRQASQASAVLAVIADAAEASVTSDVAAFAEFAVVPEVEAVMR
jgi:hypothetical protein